MVVQGDAGAAVLGQDVGDDDIAIGQVVARTRSKHADPGAGAGRLGPVAGGLVFGHRIMKDAQWLGRAGDGSRGVRGHSDAAIVDVVADLVFLDQIGVGRAGIVAEQNAPGIVFACIIDDGRVIGAEQMDALAAIIPFARLEIGNTGAGAVAERAVVAGDAVAPTT